MMPVVLGHSVVVTALLLLTTPHSVVVLCVGAYDAVRVAAPIQVCARDLA